MKRHLSDPYVKMANAQGYRSRASLKLLEMHRQYRLFKPKMQILDIGASPGGWSQVAAKHIGQHGKIIAVDLLPIEPLANVECIQGDFTDISIQMALSQKLGGQHADLVLCDIAPNFIGHAQTDHLRAMGLVESVYTTLPKLLKTQGDCLIKVFQGGQLDAFYQVFRKSFGRVLRIKPASSRQTSRELYLLGQKFKGTMAKDSCS